MVQHGLVSFILPKGCRKLKAACRTDQTCRPGNLDCFTLFGRFKHRDRFTPEAFCRYRPMTASDPASFRVLNPDGTAPVVLICDHASRAVPAGMDNLGLPRSEEHTSELQSLMRHPYAVLC